MAPEGYRFPLCVLIDRLSMAEFRRLPWGLCTAAALLLSLFSVSPAWAQHLQATVPTGFNPEAVAVNPVTNTIYVASRFNGAITIIDGSSNATRSAVTNLGSVAVAVNPVTNRIYTANLADSSVSVIDAAGGDAVTSLGAATGTSFPGAISLAVNSATNKIYVANSAGNSVGVIDGATNAVVTVGVGASPVALAINSVTNRVFVANSADNTVTVIDGTTATVIATVTVGTTPRSVAVNPVTNRIYVVNQGSNNVSVIDGSTSLVTATIAAGTGPVAVAVNPVTDKTYIANQGSNNITMLVGARNSVFTIPAGTEPAGIAINTLTNQIYVSNPGETGAGNLTVIDGLANTASTLGTSQPQPSAGLAVNPLTNRIYVANNPTAIGNGSVTVFDGSPYTTFPLTVGVGPEGMDVNPALNKAYVINNADGTLTTIDGESNALATTSLGAGSLPIAVVTNPANNDLYVLSTAFTVIIIDGTTGQVVFQGNPGNPVSWALDPVVNHFYVVDGTSGNLIDIDRDTLTTSTFGLQATKVAVNPASRKVYALTAGGNVMVLNENSRVISSVPTPFPGVIADRIYVNPTSNRIFLFKSGQNVAKQIDGATDTVIFDVVLTGTALDAVAINPVTNRMYAAISSLSQGVQIGIFDGASFQTAVTVSFGGAIVPRSLAININTNKVYATLSDGTVMVIDGVTNESFIAPVGGNLTSLVVNPVSNRVYMPVPDPSPSIAGTVKVLNEESFQTMPLTVSVNSASGSRLLSDLPQFCLTPGSTFAPFNPAVNAAWFEMDTTRLAWQPAAGAGACAFNFSVASPNNLPRGIHTAYGFVTDGLETSDGTAVQQTSSLVSRPAAFTFLAGSLDTTTSLAPPPQPVTAGDSVQLTAIAAVTQPGGPTPTGRVEFFQITNVTAANSLGTAPVDSTGHAMLTTTALINGPGAIQARYIVDDFTLKGSVSPQTAFKVRAKSTTAFTLSTPGPVPFGTPVDVTATISAVAPNFTVVPGGTVNFFIGNTQAGVAVVDVNSRATFRLTNAPAGVDAVSVAFAGSDDLGPSTAPAQNLTITQATPVITWTPPATMGFGPPLDASQLNASANTPGTFAYTPAAGTVLDLGLQHLSTTFTPNDTNDFTSATATASIQVVPGTPVITWNPTPITFGTPLGANQLNATAGLPGSAFTNIAGTFTYTPAAGTVLNAGNQPLSANFAPTDSLHFNNATGSATLVVNQASTTTLISASASSVTILVPVTFTATVLSSATGAGIPDGSVTFLDGAVSLGTHPLAGGVAVLTNTFTTPGTHSITTVYNGTNNFAGSTSAAAPITVSLLPTTTAVTASPNPAAFGAPVTLTATVTNVSGLGGNSTAFVNFFNGTTSLGGSAINAGKAFLTVSNLPSGANPITAVFAGDASFAGSTSPAITVTVSAPGLRFIPAAPCRVADTRNPAGPFGGPFLSANTTRGFTIPSSACNIPATAQAYSVNVTVVPHTTLGFLTMFPCGQPLPLASTLNSFDGRVKAGAAIIPAGTSGSICAFVTNDTDLIIDINGYFVPATDVTALAFYPVTPCRLADTRLATGPLGGPSLGGNSPRSLPILSSPCNVPPAAQAYSLNFTVVPRGPLGFLTTWPTGQAQPLVSTLNAPGGAVTANAAIVPAGTGGAISVFATNDTDLVVDINGYFAPMAAGGLSLSNVTPCRVLDTRNPSGSPPFNGTLNVNVAGSSCAPPTTAQSFVLNATVVPPGPLGFLTLWPQGGTQPLVSTLNAQDGAVTSNMAIVPTTNGSISAFVPNPTHLILDISGYFAP